MLADPRATMLVWDFDGTAAEFNPDPGAVVVDDNSQEAFAATANTFGARALLTGREARDAATRLPGLEYYAGIYGAELFVPSANSYSQDKEFFRQAPAVKRLVEQWRPAIEDAGMRIQVQGPTRLIHWSGLSDPTVGERLAATLAREAESEGLVAHPLSRCLDIRPGHIDKGIGLDRLLDKVGPFIRNVVYFGDDMRSDMAAYERLVQRTQDGRLDAVARIAVVHSDRQENEPLWERADICVQGVAGGRGLTAYLAYAARG
jgi:trehalose-phosphatase